MAYQRRIDDSAGAAFGRHWADEPTVRDTELIGAQRTKFNFRSTREALWNEKAFETQSSKCVVRGLLQR